LPAGLAAPRFRRALRHCSPIGGIPGTLPRSRACSYPAPAS
jgi:hypothetical protein